MTKIVLYGTPKKMKRQDIRAAAHFFCDNQLGRLSKTVTVVVKLRTGFFKKTRCFGMATWTDDDARRGRHREFEIDIEAGLGPVFMIRTLAHELVHVRQYARGQLIDTTYGNYQKWHGNMVNEHMVGYKELPWEKEAMKLEKELYHLWKEHYGVKREKDNSGQTT